MVKIFHGSSVNIGFEARASNKYSFYGEFGKYMPRSLYSGNYNIKGHTLIGETKRYFKNGKTYLSVQYIYGQLSYSRSDAIYYAEDYSYAEYIEYNLSRKFYGISARIGSVFIFKNGLSLNPYIGIGARYQNVKSDLSSEDESELIFNGDNSPNNWLHKSGKQIRPKIHFGLRIGFKVF